ncbi:MAG: T9SS type A sorting domain-containing protein, partial [Candidatus Cloacimonetes bacterium]|nr:T9SS type A sorting domain-containing protein [Candidatus Cloacimonadota bacterium]
VPAASFALHGCYPNPFNPTTTVRFSLAQPSDVQLDIYNVRGQHVATLVDEHMQAGEHELVWDGQDDNNRASASGIYLLRLDAGGRTATSKALLLK